MNPNIFCAGCDTYVKSGGHTCAISHDVGLHLAQCRVCQKAHEPHCKGCRFVLEHEGTDKARLVCAVHGGIPSTFHGEPFGTAEGASTCDRCPITDWPEATVAARNRITDREALKAFAAGADQLEQAFIAEAAVLKLDPIAFMRSVALASGGLDEQFLKQRGAIALLHLRLLRRKT